MPQALTEQRRAGSHRIGRRVPQMNVEQLLVLCRCLPLADRSLVENVYDKGMSPTALARAMNMQPNAVHKRLRKVVQRVASPMFGYVARQRDSLPDDTRAIAEAVVLRGQTYRAAAHTLGLSPYRVRCAMQRLEAMSEVQLRLNRS